MSSQSSSTDFLVLFGKSSKKLNSEKFYDAMNHYSDDLSIYDHQCDEIDVRTKKEEVKIICKQFLRYLKNCEVLNNGSYQYDVSILLNYWIYDKLTHIYGENNDVNISLGFSKLQYIWEYQKFHPKNEPHYHKCKPDLSMVNHEDWKERKELYDYCINYELIAPICSYFPEGCNEHCEYIEKKSHVYEHFGQYCTSAESKCPHFYERCKEYNPNIVLKTLKCPEQGKTSRDPPAEANGFHSSPGPELSYRAHGNGPGDPGNKASPHDTGLTSETTAIGTKVGHSVLGIAPVLFTATALYRYTPVGSWFRKIGGYRPNSINDMDSYSTYTEESGEMFPDSAANYVSYQPL
ncbi:PIR Superfamily Protein [Plasmodium ovale curtisi]|uniref:PIR Superfamily Protein n=1 Tax=Plasmodium ovale curtisi TaxID=864141 RepID=A0A1A8X2X5_PLAOA|nr:PIR Superfamily Protein [Plasmodium ovale curtisi]